MDGCLCIRVLIVDDSEADALLMLCALQKSIPSLESRHVQTTKELQVALQAERWDVVLCDYFKPRADVEFIVSLVATALPTISVVLITGKVGEEAVADLMRLGLADVVLKDRIPMRLAPVVIREVARARKRAASVAIQELVETILLALNNASDWREAAEIVLRHLAVKAGALLAVMWEPAGLDGIFEPIAVWSEEDWLQQKFVESETLIDLARTQLARSIAEEKPLVERCWGNICRSPSASKPTGAWQACGVASLLHQPLKVGEQVIGLCLMFGPNAQAADSVLADIKAIFLTLHAPLFHKRAELDQRLLLHALNALDSGVVITDAAIGPRGPRIIYVNSGFANMVGYDAHEVIGATSSSLLGPGMDYGVVASVEQTLLARQPCRTELAYRRRDGKPFRVELDITPVCNGTQVTHFVAIQRDITERREAELARQDRELAFNSAQARAALELEATKVRAEDAENLLRDALDSMSEGFIMYDKNDCFVMCNKAYRELYRDAVDILVPGTRYESVSSHIWQTMGGASNNESAEAYGFTMEERLLRQEKASGVPEYRLANGTWIRLTDRRMQSGGVAGLRIDVTPLKAAQAALLKSQQHFRQIAESISEMFWLWSLDDRRLLFINAAYEKLYGRTLADLERDPAEWLRAIHEDDRDRVVRDLFSGMPCPKSHIEYRIVRPSGEIRWLLACIYPGLDGDDAGSFVVGVAEDVTVRRQLEGQILQSQKMEALGNLTGGMAHDFNNILGIIIGNLELLKRHVSKDGFATELCSEAIGGALTGSNLIHDLLAFARRQSLHTKRIDLNAFIRSKQALFARMLGAHIRLERQLACDLWPTAVDVAQLESGFINLIANARDAMAVGGTLTITTRNAVLTAGDCVMTTEIDPGDYVVVEISDTGVGISPSVIGKIFEPFFTTKGRGTGTGLGLAMVYGFVKQTGGMISAASELGNGTRFCIHLPRAFGDAENLLHVGAPMGATGGYETILVVEDNAQLRNAVLSQLGDLGYCTVYASDSSEALEVLKTDKTVDLLFSDVLLPGGIDGIELAYQARLVRPQLRVLLTSGFPGFHEESNRMNAAEIAFIAKPYLQNDLAVNIRASLDS